MIGIKERGGRWARGEKGLLLGNDEGWGGGVLVGNDEWGGGGGRK